MITRNGYPHNPASPTGQRIRLSGQTVGALPGPDVRVIHRGGTDPHQHLAITGPRDRHVSDV